MASYQQMCYCKKCKTNVGLNDKGQCKKCNSSQIKKTWSVRFRTLEIKGEKQRRLTGYPTKKEAEKAYFDFMSNYTPLKSSTSTKHIFEDLLEKYFSYCSIENSGSTIYDKKHTFNLYITPYFKGKDLNLITKAELSDWQNYIWKLINPKTKKRYSWKYLTKIRGNLYNFLSYCENIHDIPNRYTTIKAPKNMDVKVDISFWEIDEFNRFIKYCDDIMWKTLWLTFLYTGARFNEIRALSDKDILDNQIIINKALAGKKVHSEIKATKNYKIIKKQIPDILASQIKEYKEWKSTNSISDKFLFGGNVPLSEKTLRRQLDKDIDNFNNLSDIKLQRITPHGFRHSYVSMLIDAGVTTKVIAVLIGDREEQVIRTYGHLYSNAKDNAIDILNKRIGQNI